MTLYLVRHGSAGRRNGADPRDPDRHLDDKGRRQADAVRRHLGDKNIDAVISSPLPRCVETVQPLADALGLEVFPEPRLREGSDAAEAWRMLEALAERNVVLCSHGDLIPDLIEASMRRGMRVPNPTGFSKGSVWTLRRWDGTHFAKASWDKLR